MKLTALKSTIDLNDRAVTDTILNLVIAIITHVVKGILPPKMKILLMLIPM